MMTLDKEMSLMKRKSILPPELRKRHVIQMQSFNRKHKKQFKTQKTRNLRVVSKEVPFEYGSQTYWENRHANDDDVKNSFEWFVSYEDVEPILKESGVNYDDRTALFADLGCGTSFFLRDLKRNGYAGPCLGIDFSKNVIEKMQQREDCEGVDFRVGYAEECNDVVRSAATILEKSLMDTILHAPEGGEEAVVKMLHGVTKSLSYDGIFISITQLDPRKADDLQFLQNVVIKALNDDESQHVHLKSVTAHITTSSNPDAPPVPTVIVYTFQKNRQKSDSMEIEIKEYDSD